MKKSVFVFCSFLMIALTGCQASNQTALETVSESTLLESQAITEGTETISETTVPETTEYVPDFEDMTLALDCQSTLDIPDLSGNFKFESEHPEIVSVDDHGLLTALSVGTANITVFLNDKEYTFEVVVTTPEISETSIRKIAGRTAQLFIYGTNGIPSFKSDNTAIATVTQDGVITACPSGVGQSTKIHTFIDSKEFVTEVVVEAVPQLMSSYKIFGSDQDDMYVKDGSYYRFQNATIELAANANEILVVEEKPKGDGTTYKESHTQTVLDFSQLDSDKEEKYPLYRSYTENLDTGNHVQVYLAGSSQDASVMIQDFRGNEISGTVTYTPNDGFGVIDVVYADLVPSIVSIKIDEITYQFAITHFSFQHFTYNEDMKKYIPPNTSILNCSVDGEVFLYDSADLVRQKSSTFWGSKAAAELGEKIVGAVEDEAISYVVGKVFTLMFL